MLYCPNSLYMNDFDFIYFRWKKNSELRKRSVKVRFMPEFIYEKNINDKNDLNFIGRN